MGTLVGHVLPGLGFLLIGLWHLFNHIKLHALHPNSYITRTWFPIFKFKYLELYLIMGGSAASVAMELFIRPTRHQPFDADGTSPSNHLHNFDHSFISMTIFVYAALAVVLNRTPAKARLELTQFLAAVAFAQELFLFHVHSTDHQGLEGQYHFLLQLLIFVSFTTVLMGIGFPKSFLIFFVRSLSICFQGVWFIVTGVMLYTPSLLPKGCAMYYDDGHLWVRCSGDEHLHRAKSLANLLFSWLLIGMTIFGVFFYLALDEIYGQNVDYISLNMEVLDDQIQAADETNDDVESQKKIYCLGPFKDLFLLKKSALLLAKTRDAW
ncbi:hypothetical protein FNV43_RR21094 [Rhamnella rubrinervis]|uniref:Transmembrane protein 45A n=1 Tax=Rhamnella rubrinervis TaxID=2594499 RepID=A0A8K0DVL6_9ROSA|nr:hypothetical protein FNV43_RR21094 [Rhamnella rubrinervis]